MDPITRERVVEEFTAIEAASFDDEKMTARIRIIRAGMSKNNRNYRPAALQQAVESRMFDSMRMFVNHSDKPPIQRDLRDMVSAIEPGTVVWNQEAQSVDGSVKFFSRPFYDFAKQAKDYMGDSINALVTGTRQRDSSGKVTEDVHSFNVVKSVDWCIFPAAGGTIQAFESEGDGEVDWADLTYDDLKKHAPTLIEEIKTKEGIQSQPVDMKKPEVSSTALTAADVSKIVAEAIATDRATQKSESDKFETIKTRVREQLSKSGLPPVTRDRIERSFSSPTIVSSFQESQVTEAITAAKEELKAAGVSGPRIAGMGPSGTSTGPDNADESTPRRISARESVNATFGMYSTKDTSKNGAGAGTAS